MKQEAQVATLAPAQEKFYVVADKLGHELKTAHEYLTSDNQALAGEARRIVESYRALREQPVPDLKGLYDAATDLIEFDKLDDVRYRGMFNAAEIARVDEDMKDNLADNERIKKRRLNRVDTGGSNWDKAGYALARIGNVVASYVASRVALEHAAKDYEELAIAVMGAAIVWGEFAISRWKDRKRKQIDRDYVFWRKKHKHGGREEKAKAREWLTEQKRTIYTKADMKRREMYKLCFGNELSGDTATEADEKMEERMGLQDEPLEKAIGRPAPRPPEMLRRAKTYQRRLQRQLGDGKNEKD